MVDTLLWIGLGVVLLLAFLFYAAFIGVTMQYNSQLRRKYEEMMVHMRAHHPAAASRIELKRVLGLYPTGAYRPSILFARNHPDLNDAKAEELLAEFARASELSALFVLVKERLSAVGSWVGRRS